MAQGNAKKQSLDHGDLVGKADDDAFLLVEAGADHIAFILVEDIGPA